MPPKRPIRVQLTLSPAAHRLLRRHLFTAASCVRAAHIVCRLTGCQHHAEEGRIQGAHMRGLACKHVVQRKVDHVEQAEHAAPAKVHGQQLVADDAGEVGDNAQAIKLACMCNDSTGWTHGTWRRIVKAF